MRRCGRPSDFSCGPLLAILPFVILYYFKHFTYFEKLVHSVLYTVSSVHIYFVNFCLQNCTNVISESIEDLEKIMREQIVDRWYNAIFNKLNKSFGTFTRFLSVLIIFVFAFFMSFLPNDSDELRVIMTAWYPWNLRII